MIANLIDHTLLKPDAREQEIINLIEEAKQYKFASVCINPYWVPLAAEKLQGSDVKVCTVIGFPLGSTTTAVKVFEAEEAIQKGAQEIDMVINIGLLKAGEDAKVEADIKAVADATHGNKALLKVIIETCLLTEDEKIRACQAAVKAGADFVKTSTGFSIGGATVEDVALMRKIVGEACGVKASGGVRNKTDLDQMVAAGANRIGASSGVKIMQGLTAETSY
ncbi:deoxyribose-phosphate aldolase [Bacillus tuaregi]|uniref:deoxyribose-phosphate aldolase n=1 Tax=Bacillus tuaregi TaxID=1816695 RepID=UPI0008F88B1B